MFIEIPLYILNNPSKNIHENKNASESKRSFKAIYESKKYRQDATLMSFSYWINSTPELSKFSKFSRVKKYFSQIY